MERVRVLRKLPADYFKLIAAHDGVIGPTTMDRYTPGIMNGIIKNDVEGRGDPDRKVNEALPPTDNDQTRSRKAGGTSPHNCQSTGQQDFESHEMRVLRSETSANDGRMSKPVQRTGGHIEDRGTENQITGDGGGMLGGSDADKNV
ncbi:hypothetical protein L218DRAFT_1002949 [Marasmius fiardii PR-910]|nr:hypothetical protein L218DRAFT_1002949 [Marasmius fiardii PR-910]